MIKKFFFILFNVLGFITFLGLVSAAAYLGIRHYKIQAVTETTMTADTTSVIRTVSMTPEKTDNLATTAQTLPHFQPISRKSAEAKAKADKTKPVRQAQRKPDTIVSAPVMYAAPKVKRTITVKPTVVKAKPKYQKPRPATTTHADLGLPEELPRRYQVTDRTASPRTGSSRIPDVYAPPSELELQAKRQVQMEQLKQAAKEIREPKGFESGLLKFLGGK